MKFNKVCMRVRSSVMTSELVVCYEHEIPILQARFGKTKVEEVDDPANLAGPVDGDFDLNAEWDRLMERPAIVQVGENQAIPAPLHVFPRGALDLEDFYARIRRNNVVDIPAQKPASERDLLKAKLDEAGIEYKGNASTISLKALYESIEDDDVSTDIQNQG